MKKNFCLMHFKWLSSLIFLNLLFSQTEKQIKQAKDFIRQNQMTKQEAIDVAKKRGFSEKQIQDVLDKEKSSTLEKRSNENNLKSFENAKNKNELIDLNGNSSLNVKDDNKDLDQDEKISDLMEEEDETLDVESAPMQGIANLNYYGYEIFQRDPSLFQTTSFGAVDPDYLIGPNDNIIVMLWGETQFRNELTVDREGFIFIPEIGQVFVNGLNLNLLESKLFRVFSKAYSSLNPSGRKPTTFLDVSLGDLRPLRIQVLGEVRQPGAYVVSPSSTLFSSLYYFDGPTYLGSLRDIQLMRGGEKVRSIDFYDYLQTGKKPNDQQLQLDDVIFIPKRLKTVSISGEVNRQGIYELKPEEDFLDLLKFCGDLKPTAYLGRCQVDRIVPFKDRALTGMDRIYKDVDLEKILESDERLLLQDGDVINIYSILSQRPNTVELQGAVTRPGRYDIGESLTLSELISKADGLTGNAYMDKVDVFRTNSDLTEELLKMDLQQVIEKDPTQDIKLQPMDRVTVYNRSAMIPKGTVTISGHVKRPGRIEIAENMTLYDLIFYAGAAGLDEDFKNRTYSQRADLIRLNDLGDDKKIISFNLNQVLNQEGLFDEPLRHGDAIRIYSREEIKGGNGTVNVTGHVKRPGPYELYEENMRISDLLFMAGGFDDPSFKSRAFMDRADLFRFDPNGVTKSIYSFNLDSVLNGDTNPDNLHLKDGDEIRIFPKSIFNFQKPVSIYGEIRNEGVYDLKTEMTLKDLFLEAGGLNNFNTRCRVEISRIDPLNENPSHYAKNSVLYMDSDYRVLDYENYENFEASKENIAEEFLLNPHDLIYVRSDPFFAFQKTVSIQGEVMYPGDYTILSSKEKLSDIVNRAGGLTLEAYPGGSSFIRGNDTIKIDFQKILRKKNSKVNFNLKNGDIIKIASKSSIVTIVGEVNNPGVQKFFKGKRLRYYLRTSGGLSPNAEKNNIWVVHPNGESIKYKNWSLFSPHIKDGSVINVGTKPEEEPVDKTELAKEITSILANLAQVIAIVNLVKQ